MEKGLGIYFREDIYNVLGVLKDMAEIAGTGRSDDFIDGLVTGIRLSAKAFDVDLDTTVKSPWKELTDGSNATEEGQSLREVSSPTHP